MSDQESFREQRRKWREDRKKMRDEMREQWRSRFQDRQHMMFRSRGSGIWTGLFILLIGVAALTKATVTDLPSWYFSWQTFLIALGVFIGIKHSFRGGAWFILMLVGGAFLVPEINPDITIRRYIWPVVLIAIGLFLVLRRIGERFHHDDDEKKNSPNSGVEGATIIDESHDSKEDFIHATSVFGGTKKNIISKNFRGGDLVSVFGGTEVDLTRADFTGTASLELTTIFGGTKLIVPSDWEVKSEAAVIFGGIEDKRAITASPEGTPKRLVLKGTIMFGGVDIKSY